jgi:hypothetical protein
MNGLKSKIPDLERLSKNSSDQIGEERAEYLIGALFIEEDYTDADQIVEP